ncbi:MAG: polysaccharide biosynthesis C-terminal domain-containing protein [Flavobacteriales bacterium]|nr:polysaccharide biosynthesis C-terminal domain-containing protein [Flavobacteriales bacterium]
MTSVRALQFFQVLRFGTFFLTGILFAKFGLSTYDIGIYESLLFLGSVLSFFWLSGLTQSLLANYQPNEKSKEFFNAFLVLLGLSVLVFIAFRLLITPYSFMANNPEVLYFYGTFSFYLLFIGPSFLAEYVLLLKEKANGLAAYGIVAFGIQLAAVALPIAFGYGLEEALFGLVASSVVRFMITLGLLAKYAEFKLDTGFLQQFLVTAGPLMAATLLSGSAEYLDGFIVSKYFDEGTFAVYRYGAKEFPLVLLLANAFSNGMVPKVAQLGIKEVAATIKKESLKLMHLFFPISIGFMLVSEWIYPRLFNPDFIESAAVFNVYLLLVVSRLVFPQTLLIGLKKTKTIMVVAGLEIAVNFGLSLLFVQQFGLVGIAFATVIASVLDKVMLMILLRKLEGISVATYWPWKWHLGYSTLLVLIFCWLSFS